MKNHSAHLVLFGILLCGALHAQPPVYVPTDGLQLWYDFNNSIDDYDPNSLSIATSPNCLPGIDRFGDTSGSALFTQLNSNVLANIPSFTNPFVSGDLGLSINLWYSADFEEESGVLAQCFDYDGPNGGWKIEWLKTPENTTEISASYRNFIIDSCASVVTIPEYDFAWHMVTVVIDVIGINIYIDGVSLGTGSWQNGELEPPLITSPFIDPLYIGNRPSPQSVATAFNGRIDDFGLWSRPLTPQEITDLGTEPATAGCNNSNACNYIDNPAITEYDGSCSFVCVGCMLPYACNYDQNATINEPDSCDLSCIADTISLIAFLDMNANGIFDSEETPLEYWPIHLLGPDSLRVFTELDGHFRWPNFGGLPLHPGDFSIEIEYDESSWEATLPALQTRIIPTEDDTVKFGLRPSNNIPSAGIKIMRGFWDAVHCETGYSSGIRIENTGGTALNGTVRLFCDDLFNIGADYTDNLDPDSSGAGAARWDIVGLQPGTSRVYSFHTLADLGAQSEFTFNYQIALDTNGTEVINTALSETVNADCSTAPDAKVLASPPGAYTPNNFILTGENIEYRIAFQNVGPGAADNVLVSTNLNSSQVDLASFDIMASSSALIGCLHDDGTLQIMLSELILPDTATDPVASNGFVVFSVRALPEEIQGDSVAINPIIFLSNDIRYDSACYVHHIFRCNSLQPPLLEPAVINPLYGYTTSLDACNEFIESYEWSFEGDNGWSFSTNDSCAVVFNTLDSAPNSVPDNFTMTLSISNALCDTTFSNVVYLINTPEEEPMSLFKVYPNPVHTSCTIELPTNGFDVFLYDANGRKIKEWNNCDRILNIAKGSLSNGFYSLVAISKEETFTTQIAFE